MTEEIRRMLANLDGRFNAALDLIHDELLAKLRTMARSTGQRTRTDRLDWGSVTKPFGQEAHSLNRNQAKSVQFRMYLNNVQMGDPVGQRTRTDR